MEGGWLGRKTTSNHCSVTQVAYELSGASTQLTVWIKMMVVRPVDRPDYCTYLHHMFTNHIPALVLHAMIAVVKDMKHGSMSTT